MARLSAPALASIEEPVLPLEQLLGPAATDLLRVAVAEAGGDLCSAQPRQVIYHPRRSLTVRFDAKLRLPGTAATATATSLIASVGGTPPEGAAVVGDGTHEVAVWQLARDPHLPGLAAALDPRSLGILLRDLGVRVERPTAHLRAYRPGRRAVVEVHAGDHRVFLKVVRPRKIARLRERHLLLSDHVPVPRPLGWSPEHGVLVLQALGGTTLRQALLTTDVAPSGRAVVAMLDALPTPRASSPERTNRGAGWQTNRFASMIGSVVPAIRDRVEVLATTLAEIELQVDEDVPLVPVHGDLHEAQLLVRGTRITGVLDVDTFGMGRRVDELGALIGHLSTLARVTGSQQVHRYAASLLGHFDRVVDPVHLRHAAAAASLGLATGPFRVLEQNWETSTVERVALAEQWAESAEALAPRRERGLIAASPLTHPRM